MNGHRHPGLDPTLAMLAQVEFLRAELTRARDHLVWLALQRGGSRREVARVACTSPTTVQNLAARHAHWPGLAVYGRVDITSM